MVEILVEVPVTKLLSWVQWPMQPYDCGGGPYVDLYVYEGDKFWIAEIQKYIDSVPGMC